MRKLITIFPGFRNFHFYKDPGQIPYRFCRKGIDSEIVCYQNETSYHQTNQFIQVKAIPKTILTLRLNFGIIWYLIQNANKIDVLNVFHFQWSSFWFSFIYKLINRHGFVYLKMDNCNYCGPYAWELLFDKKNQTNLSSMGKKKHLKSSFKDYLIPKLTSYIDLWSIEDQASCEYYEKKYNFFKNKIITIFNGHTIDIYSKNIEVIEFNKKKNIILTVSNLGTYSKATDILLNSYIAIAKQTTWDLYLAGSIAQEFESTIDNYFKENPELGSRVIIFGSVDKKELFDLYNQSKIFCLPSRWEGFANVYSEAMYFRNAIVTTSTTSLRDIILDNQCGELVEVDNVEQLSKTLLSIINDYSLNERYSNNAKMFCDRHLSWDKITDKLQTEIERRRTF